MPLSEDEEFELLSLEREKAMNSKQSPQKETVPVQEESIPQMIGNNFVEAVKATGQSALKTANEAVFGLPGLAYEKMTGNKFPEDALTEEAKQMATGAAIVSPGPLNMIGKGGAKLLKGLLKSEEDLQKTIKAKESLDTIRKTLGEASELAIKQVENVPAKVAFNMIKSDKVMKAIKNPVYEVAFDKTGRVIPTVGNLNKAKKAVGELISSPTVWEEAPKTELQHIKQFYGHLNQAMKSAASKAGKPIDKALGAYDDFMDKYNLVNKTIVDRAGNAMAVKMSKVFQIGAEPAYKQAWKDVAKMSPEFNKIMGDMKKQALLRDILKVAVPAAGIATAGAVGGGIVNAIKNQN